MAVPLPISSRRAIDARPENSSARSFAGSASYPSASTPRNSKPTKLRAISNFAATPIHHRHRPPSSRIKVAACLASIDWRRDLTRHQPVVFDDY
jgi:hypothetical protein